MKTLEEKIEVMQACLDGKTIEIFEDGIWNDWKANRQFPDFNWTDFDYRIKPENKQVPFDFSDVESLIGRRFKSINGDYYYIATRVDKNLMRFGELLYNYDEVAKYLLIWNNTLNSWEPCTKTVKE